MSVNFIVILTIFFLFKYYKTEKKYKSKEYAKTSVIKYK